MTLKHLLAASAGLAALSTMALAQETEPPAEDAPAESETEVLLTEDGQLDLEAMLAAAKEEAQAASERLEREKVETERLRAETAAITEIAEESRKALKD